MAIFSVTSTVTRKSLMNKSKWDLACLVLEQMDINAELQKVSVCQWSENEDSNLWETSCEHAWTFIDDGPKENGLKFCPFCGGVVSVITPNDEIEGGE